MSNTPLGYYKWFPRDFYSSVTVRGMSFTARAIYRELLDIQWESERLPNAKQLPSILQVTLEQWNEFAEHLDVLFPDGQNERLKSLRDEAVERSAKAAKSGSKGGKCKRTPSKRLPKAKRTSSQTETETETDIVDKSTSVEGKLRPSMVEVISKMKELGFADPDTEASAWWDYHEGNQWMISGKPMANWRLTCSTWKRNAVKFGKFPGVAPKTKSTDPILGVDYLLDLKTGKRIPVSEVDDND